MWHALDHKRMAGIVADHDRPGLTPLYLSIRFYHDRLLLMKIKYSNVFGFNKSLGQGFCVDKNLCEFFSGGIFRVFL